ncbi:hypothetical protein RRG08_056030 [Elysia crispata]|uniref:Uncharacterized protein n=1 Tax=Elysia crispata TaxID=231223 RepID=A0AAE1AG38_9GAST|nr:hypothetical protein RRG08_056030 [Elysia crispata]
MEPDNSVGRASGQEFDGLDSNLDMSFRRHSETPLSLSLSLKVECSKCHSPKPNRVNFEEKQRNINYLVTERDALLGREKKKGWVGGVKNKCTIFTLTRSSLERRNSVYAEGHDSRSIHSQDSNRFKIRGPTRGSPTRNTKTLRPRGRDKTVRSRQRVST